MLNLIIPGEISSLSLSVNSNKYPWKVFIPVFTAPSLPRPSLCLQSPFWHLRKPWLGDSVRLTVFLGHREGEQWDSVEASLTEPS